MKNYQKSTGFFRSADGKTDVAYYIYTPAAGSPRGVIQLCHGMVEYIERYEPWIDLLAGAGWAVAGNDHLGHGSTGSPENYGFFAEKDGYTLLLRDMKTMHSRIRELFPGIPLVLYGHSMGSFFARYYAENYPQDMDALVISGTAGPSPINRMGLLLAKYYCRFHGPRYVAQALVDATVGSYSKGLPRKSAWITHDDAVCDAYEADPKCSFPFTASAYRDMLTVLVRVNTPASAQGIRKDLPIYIMSGDADPVGANGKGPTDVAKLLRDAGAQNVTLRLYPGDRHELHNELDREKVFADLKDWLEKAT